MKRLATVASVLAVLGIVPAFAQEKTPTIKEVMTKLHRGADCLRARLGKALKAEAPAWDDVQQQTKEFARLAEALGKNRPPQGDKASWERLADEFGKQAKAMNEAAEKKSKAEVQATLAKLGNCATCHKAHKP
jgi:cytochrome c556